MVPHNPVINSSIQIGSSLLILSSKTKIPMLVFQYIIICNTLVLFMFVAADQSAWWTFFWSNSAGRIME